MFGFMGMFLGEFLIWYEMIGIRSLFVEFVIFREGKGGIEMF